MTTINESEQMVTIQTETGERTVMAYLIGEYLAVNHSNGPGGHAWRITHMHTGWALPYAYRTSKDAIVSANKIKGLNWSFKKKISKGLKNKVIELLGEYL